MSTEANTVIKSSNVAFPSVLNVTLGQALSEEATASFSGRIADFGLWQGQLSQETIKSLANCEEVVNRGLLVDFDVDGWNRSQVSISFSSPILLLTFPLNLSCDYRLKPSRFQALICAASL